MSWVEFVEKAGPWVAAQGIGTVLTALFALLVWMEARRIRRAEWVLHVLGKWQDFNMFLVETKLSDRWEKIRQGCVDTKELTAADRRLLLMFFNIQQIEYSASARFLTHPHVRDAMRAGIADMAAIKPFVIKLLVDGGYDMQFRNFASKALDGK